MAETEQLKIQIVLDDGSIKDGFIAVEKQAKKTSDNIAGSFDGLKDTFKSLAGAFAAAFAAKKVINYLQDSAKAAMEAEQATNALAASLAQIGKLTPQALNSFQEYASELQRTTGVSDDLIIQNAALLTSIGKLSGEGLNQATKASLDLATALQIDVGTAFDLVAKAASGNTGALSRYGIKIDENIPKAEKFAHTLKLIQDRFGGLAGTRLNTLEGALTNFGNAFGEIQESLGKFITESPAVRVAINFIAESFMSISKSIDTLRGGSGDIFKPIILGALQLAQYLNEYLIKPLELGFNLIRTGVMAIYSAVQGLIALFVNFGDVILKYVFQPIIEGFGFIGEKIVGLFNAEMAAKLKANISAFATEIGGGLGTLADSTSSVFKDSFDSLATSADNTFRSSMVGSIDAYISKLSEAVEKSSMATNNFKNNGAEMAETTKVYSQSIIAQANAMRAGLTTSIASIGAALVKGEGLFDNFGAGVVGIIGDLAISIGSTLFVTCLAIEKFIASINSLLPGSGALAAAAGLGLIIFGGALKASVGKSGGSAPSSSGGGIASSPSSTTENTPTEDLARLEPQTAVQITVQGDILDSDESGSRIVSLINSAFEKKGVVINQGVMA